MGSGIVIVKELWLRINSEKKMQNGYFHKI